MTKHYGGDFPGQAIVTVPVWTLVAWQQPPLPYTLRSRSRKFLVFLALNLAFTTLQNTLMPMFCFRIAWHSIEITQNRLLVLHLLFAFRPHFAYIFHPPHELASISLCIWFNNHQLIYLNCSNSWLGIIYHSSMLISAFSTLRGFWRARKRKTAYDLQESLTDWQLRLVTTNVSYFSLISNKVCCCIAKGWASRWLYMFRYGINHINSDILWLVGNKVFW